MDKLVTMSAVALLTALGATAHAGEVGFYGGDPDLQFSFANSRDVELSDAFLYDDFEWDGGRVSELFATYSTDLTAIHGMEFEIRSGVTAGNGGTLVRSETLLNSAAGSPISWTDTGVDQGTSFVTDLYKGVMDVTDFHLAAGTYHLGLRVVGSGTGFAGTVTTQGTNGIGTPLDNGNSFITFVDFNSGNTRNFVSLQDTFNFKADFSQGVVAVPLPPAAWLGLGMLGMLGLMRRRARGRAVA